MTACQAVSLTFLSGCSASSHSSRARTATMSQSKFKILDDDDIEYLGVKYTVTPQQAGRDVDEAKSATDAPTPGARAMRDTGFEQELIGKLTEYVENAYGVTWVDYIAAIEAARPECLKSDGTLKLGVAWRLKHVLAGRTSRAVRQVLGCSRVACSAALERTQHP